MNTTYKNLDERLNKLSGPELLFILGDKEDWSNGFTDMLISMIKFKIQHHEKDTSQVIKSLELIESGYFKQH